LPTRDLVLIGASAGGVDALIRLVGAMPADLDACVLVVLHLPPRGRTNLPAILTRSGPLPAVEAEDGMPLRRGRIMTAPADHHLVVDAEQVAVARGPRENLHRPSVDVLLRSAAVNHGSRCCAIVLSGALDDGTSGMRAIAAVGGLTVVQDPADALVSSMPEHVLEAIVPDEVLAADEIGRRLAELLRHAGPVPVHGFDDHRTTLVQEVAMSRLEPASLDHDPPGSPSKFGCPDCGGVLWEITDGDGLRYRCRVGLAYTTLSLVSAGDSRLEDALWAALRALEEQETLARRMLDRPWAGGSEATRERLEERVEAASRRAAVLRELLLRPTAGGIGARAASVTAAGAVSEQAAG
jgi:two-component system, chemotaxis family, protein-glutamate methylesterase/glutaminase